ncbi:MAG: hypothetical protein HOV79_02790 [Hamadaea sp.]|nr:hypothetical protein [Hamadaea sp.]
MSVRELLVSATPMAADVYTMSAGRVGAMVGGLTGLAGVIVGSLALARPGSRFGTATGSLGAIVALAAGIIALAVASVVVATSDAGIGTGNGRGGAYVGLVVGAISVVLGGVALVRFRRTA